MKQANEAKLKELNKKKVEFESILKTHRRELEVSCSLNAFICMNKSIKHRSFIDTHLFIPMQIFGNTRTKCQNQRDVAKKNLTKLFEEKSNY